MKQSEKPPRKAILMLSPKEHLFVLMCCMLGYSCTAAYLAAIDGTVKRSSAQVLGSHLRKESRIQAAARKLLGIYPNAPYFNVDFIQFFGNQN